MIENYKNLKRILSFIIAFSLLLAGPLLLPLNAYATINETFNFQAKLTNVNGTNVADGTYNFRFSIYDASAAGNCLWTSKGTIPGSGSCSYAAGSPGTDLVAVTVTNGLFNVNLGTSTGGLTTFEDVSANLAKFSNSSLYLDIQVYNGSSWETFGSRKLLESVPYAFRAKYADTSTNVPLSGITAATTTNTIDNLLNAQTWNWSTLSTQTALSYSANALTTGSVLGISSSTTAASASGDLVKFELTGNSANVTGNALKVGVTGGSSTTATALNVTSAGTGLVFRVNDDGTYTDSTPFIIDTSGNVAIGATAATARLSVSPATTNTGRAIDAGASLTSTGTTYSIYNAISTSGTDSSENIYGLYNTGSSATVGAGGAPTARLIGVYNALTASATGLPAHDNRIIGMYTDLTTTGTRNPVGYGSYFVTNASTTTGTQYVSYADMTSGTTTKWGLYFTGESNNYLSGNLGIGDNSPASALTVGNNDLFQVNSSGNIVKINNVTTSFPGSQGGANSLLLNDGSGNLSWVTSLTGVTIPISKLAAAGATNTIDNTLYAQQWDWSTLSTQNALTLTGNALTTGNVLGVTSSTTAVSASGDVVKFEQTGNSANFTGNTLKVGITGASSAGVPLNVTNAGTGFSFLVNDDGTYADTSPFSINASGDVGIGTTTPDSTLEVKNSGFPQLTLRNGGSSRLWIGTDLTDFIFKASNDYSADSWKFRSNNNDDVVTINTAAPVGSLFIDSAGNVGLQDVTPASLLTVGNGDLFQVDSSGNIVKINNVTTSFPASQGGSNTYLKNNGSGVLTWSTVSASASLGALTAAAQTNTIDNTLYAQQWDWSTLSTQNALTLTGNGISTGNLLSLSSSSTAATSSSLLSILATGTPGTSWTGALGKIEYTTSTSSNINGDALRIGITGAGAGQGTALNITTAQTGTNALALRVNDDGTYTDSSPFIIDKAGSVGIGVTSVGSERLNIDNALRLVTSGTPEAGYLFGSSIPSGSVTEGSGSILSYGINVPQVGTRNDASLGGIFRLDTRGGLYENYSFVVYGYPASGGNAAYERLAINLQNGNTFLSPTGGNVGIGGYGATSMFNVGSSDQFQVNSSGNIVKINNVTTSFPGSQGGSNTYLKNDGSGNLTWSTVSASASINGLTLATGTNTIDNTLYAQQWDWSTLSTQNALTLTSNGITTGNLLSLTSTSTALTSSSLLNVLATGDPAASWTGALAKVEYTTSIDTDINGDALRVGITGAGTGQGTALNITSAQTGTNAFVLKVNDDGTYTDTTAFTIDKTGVIRAGGQYLAPDGAVATPSFAFLNNTNMGFYRQANNVMGTSVNGQGGFYLDGTSGTGRVSIDYPGATVSKFQISSDLNTAAGGITLGTNAGTYIQIYKSGSNQLAIDGGSVGIGDSSPASLLTVGNGDLFQVNSSGNIVKINNVTTSFPGSQGGANSVLLNDGSGNLSWVTALTGVTIPISKLAVAAGTNTIDNTLYAQQWDWSTLSTQNALTLTGNGISTGNLLSLSSSSTVATSSSLLNILATGTPGTSWTGALGKIEYTTSTSSNINGDALRIGITGAGAGQATALNITSAQTGTSALALRVNDDGTYTDSTPFVVDKAGNVGIGTATPKAALHSLVGTTGTMAFPYESAAFENSGDNKVGIFTSGAAFGNGAALTFGDSKATNGSGRIPGFELQYIGNTSSTSTYLRINYLERDSTAGTVTASAANIFNLFGGAATANGRVAIIGGGASFNTFSVGGSGEFQIDSSGNIVKLNNVTTSFPSSQGGSNTYLKNNGSGVLTWSTVSASASLSGLSIATGTNTIDNTLYAQQWDWSTLSTQDALKLTGAGISTGNLFSLTSSSTAFTSGSLLNILATGTPGSSWTGALGKIEYTTSTSSNINGDALRIGITGAGAGQATALNITSAQTGTNALIFRVNDDGTYTDSTPFAVDKDGNVGIGTTAPGAKLQVVGGNILLDNASKVYMTSITNGAGYYFDGSSAWGLRGFNSGANYYTDVLFDSTGGSGNNTRGVRIMDTNGSAVRVLVGDTGNVGIGDTTPASLLTVGNGDLFQVNSSGQIAAAAGIISSGTIQFSALTTNGALYTSGSNGTLTTTAPTSGAIGYWKRTSTTLAPTTANDLVSIANTTTTGADFGITNTGIYTGTGIFNLTANSATTGQLAQISGTGITTGDALKIVGGTAMTTGNDIELNGATYVHGANSEVGSLALMMFSDTTSGAYTSTTNGIQLQPTINITAGAANKTINGISVEPTFTACTTATCTVTGLNVANVTDSGNFNSTGLKIGTGWDEAIRANGAVVIGAQTDTASTGSSTYTITNSAAGTFVASTDTAMDKIKASAVYKGKLFVATGENNGAAVYRYDGGTTWVRVTSTTLGRVLSTDTTVVDGYAMTVFDGKLWIGSQTGADVLAGIYYSTTADTASAGDNFTMVNSARGTISAASQEGISAMVVYNGQLIIATQKAQGATINRYEGGTTFTIINTAGKSAAETTADKDAFSLVVCANVLYNGGITASNTGIVAAYQGNGTTWIHTTGTTGGGAFGAETATSDIDSLACYNGALYMAASKTAGNAAAIYYYKATPTPVANVAANWVRINVAVGKMLNADSAVIDKFILGVYNGRLYAGSQTATGDGAGALFEYSGIPLADWTLMTTGARGTFGSQTGVDSISDFTDFNGTLYVGTDDLTAGVGSVYSWNKTAQNSFALKFDSGSSNYGAISFVGNMQSGSNLNQYGSFLFSNSVQLDAGAFDYAEDYPTKDSSLNPGDLITVDTNNPGYVVRAKEGSSVIGIVSKDPGFRLSSKEKLDAGARWVPIALVGRVPVKVTSMNGTIQIGDKITTSSIKGVGMKASGRSDTVGVTLDSFLETDPNVIGEVTVFIDLNYTDTHISKEEFDQYNVNVTENPLDNSKIYTLANSDLSKSINELGLYDQLKSANITSGNLITTDLTINGINFANYISDLNTKLTLLESEAKPKETAAIAPVTEKTEVKGVTTTPDSEFDTLRKQLITMIDDKFTSLSSVNTINTDFIGASSTSINLPKLNTFLSKVNILEDGSLEILGNVKFSEMLNVENFKTKKISAFSGSDLIAELSDDSGKSKFSIVSLTGKELFSVDSTGKTNINNDLSVKGDLNISGKIAGDSVFESKWIEISPNSEVSVKHDLGVIPRSINILRASESDCESKNGEMDCSNVTNEGFGNKEVYYFKNLDKSSLKVVNALSDKIFVKVFVTK